MRLRNALLGLLALAASVTADELTVLSRYTFKGATTSRTAGIWTTTYGSYNINPGNGNGCGTVGWVLGLKQVCLNWDKDTGHFTFENQGQRCLTKWNSQDIRTCGVGSSCEMVKWREVPC